MEHELGVKLLDLPWSLYEFLFLRQHWYRGVPLQRHVLLYTRSGYNCKMARCPGKIFLKISQMLVVCICFSYNFHIFLSFASESRVARNTILLQRDVLRTVVRFNDGPGWCNDERGRPLRGYYQFHVQQNNSIYPQDMLY